MNQVCHMPQLKQPMITTETKLARAYGSWARDSRDRRDKTAKPMLINTPAPMAPSSYHVCMKMLCE